MHAFATYWLALLLALAPLAGAMASDRAERLARAQAAVVGLRVTALAGAHSNATLGRERAGSGVLLDADGLVLTIGYLLLEADEVDLELPGERSVPAHVVAADPATGLGLVRALVALPIAPAQLGSSSSVARGEPLFFSTGGAQADAGQARLVARRVFTGSWEYQVDDALIVAPARADHSGAGLFNARGELVGVGSLIVSDALGPGQPRMAGNLFVPVDLLPPVLGEMLRSGSSRRSHRPWLGVHCAEQGGQLAVIRVSPDSPAEAAGLQPGDRIERIDGIAVASLAAFYGALWRDGSTAQREVRLDIRRAGTALAVSLRSADRMDHLRQARGV